MTNDPPPFDRIHAICVRLRNAPCKLCPHAYDHPQHGRMSAGCRMLAEEVATIAVHGNPWGPCASQLHLVLVERWRERFNEE